MMRKINDSIINTSQDKYIIIVQTTRKSKKAIDSTQIYLKK